MKPLHDSERFERVSEKTAAPAEHRNPLHYFWQKTHKKQVFE